MPESSRRCLITGANAGIGRAAALQLASAGHQVILGCRDAQRGDAAARSIREHVENARVEVVTLDMASRRSIEAAAIAVGAVDVLIHNAAAFDISQQHRRVTAEGFEEIWATNHLGPVHLTQLLLPRLLESVDPRVIIVTSKGLAVTPWLAIQLDDVQFERRRFSVPRAYYQSKLAQLAWMVDLAESLKTTSIRVHGVRVTNVKIDLDRYPHLGRLARYAYALKSRFSITPEEMARTYVWAATASAPATPAVSTGGYFDGIDRPAPLSRWALAPANRAALMALTRRQLSASSVA